MSTGEGFRELAGVDRVLHEPARLILMALLYPLESADFLYLLRETGLTKATFRHTWRGWRRRATSMFRRASAERSLERSTA